MKTIEFKYNIGDKVTLIKEPSWDNRALLNYNRDFSPKEYRVKSLKYVVDKNGEKILYSLYAYGDEYLCYDNWLTENFIAETENKHSFEEDVDFVSVDGEELSIGDAVYSSVYYGGKDNQYISPNLTFTAKIVIDRLEYVMEGTFYRDSGVGTVTRTEFFGEQIDNICQSNAIRRSGFTYVALKNPDTDFADEYIRACKRNRFNLSNNEHARKWLEIMGVLEYVEKNYKKVTIKKSTAVEKKKSKVEDIFEGLTARQKKEMLKLLTKDGNN